MGKKRDLDRLGHYMMRKTALLTASLNDVAVKVVDVDRLKNKQKIDILMKVINGLTMNTRNVANIMATAQDAKVISFSEEDSNSMTMEDIASELNIKIETAYDDDDYEEELSNKTEETVPDNVKKAMDELASKFGDKANITAVPIKVTKEQAKELEELLSKLSKGSK